MKIKRKTLDRNGSNIVTCIDTLGDAFLQCSPALPRVFDAMLAARRFETLMRVVLTSVQPNTEALEAALAYEDMATLHRIKAMNPHNGALIHAAEVEEAKLVALANAGRGSDVQEATRGTVEAAPGESCVPGPAVSSV